MSATPVSQAAEPNALALLRLLQLSSPALPIGAFAYSHGMESAVERGWLADEPSTERWILGVLTRGLGRLDAPVFARLYRAWQADDAAGVGRWACLLNAARESRELLAEDRHLGQALARLLVDQGIRAAQEWLGDERVNHATMFALAAVTYDVTLEASCQALLFSWAENQVSCATRLLPLGQLAAQRVLSRVLLHIPDTAAFALQLSDDDVGATTPGLAVASALHETQYTRLFRS